MDRQQKINEFKELTKGENEINNELNNSKGIEKGFKKFCLLNKDWVFKYKKFLLENKDNRNNGGDLLNIKSIKKNNVERDFTYVNKDFSFYFPSNFALVSENFINLLFKHLKKSEQEILKKGFFHIIIGGQCLIMKDHHKNISTYAYISLYNEDKNEFSHEIDFF